MSKRTTVYVKDNTLGKFETYKMSLPKDEKISFSELVNTLLESYLNNPFNWNDQMLYSYAIEKYGECEDEEEY